MVLKLPQLLAKVLNQNLKAIIRKIIHLYMIWQDIKVFVSINSQRRVRVRIDNTRIGLPLHTLAFAKLAMHYGICNCILNE